MTAVLGEDEESADHPAFAYGRAGKKKKGRACWNTRSAEEGVESKESEPKKTWYCPAVFSFLPIIHL